MKTKIFLIIILLIAACLRLYKLDSIPPHLTPDEAALGYNAYSILKTGKDEYGESFPMVFKSFGDYKPGLYIYAAVPSVAILGLTEFATRFPSALAGIIAVMLVYLITKQLFKSDKLSLLAAFFLAISPWHIQFSRGAWEVNLSLTLTLLGIYLFFVGLKKNFFFVISAIVFALTLLAYQGAKLSTGIVILILGILYFKDVLKLNKKYLVTAIFLGGLISFPILTSLVSGKAGRLAVFSVFSYPRPSEVTNAFLDQANEQKGELSYYLFHSDTYDTFRGIWGRYFNHFSGRFLFFEGDWQNPRHTAPNHGVLLLSDAVLLIAGLVYLVRNKIQKEHVFVILWLLLAPLPAVLSRDQIHAVRSFNLVVPLMILLAMGAHLLSKKIAIVIAVIMIASYIYFLDAYFIHLPNHTSKQWEYGYKQIVETVTPIQNNYKTIRVQQSYAQPYIYFLFYQKYDPASYQKKANLIAGDVEGDVGKVEHLDNICFCAIDWSVNRGDRDTLFVADLIRIPREDSSDEKQFNIIREIKYLDNIYTAFRIIDVKR